MPSDSQIVAFFNEKGVGTYCLYPFSEASRIAFVAG